MINKNWKITFFSEKVEKTTLGLPKSILADLLSIFDMVEEVGPNLGRPHSAPLKDGLFEFRAKGKEGISRSISRKLWVRAPRIRIMLDSVSTASPESPGAPTWGESGGIESVGDIRQGYQAPEAWASWPGSMPEPSMC